MRTLQWLLIPLLLTSCSLGPNSGDWVQVKVALPQKGNSLSSLLQSPGRDPSDALTAPTTVDGFDCYAVNVYGQGIGLVPSSQACSYPGVTSSLATSNQTALKLNVPSGPARTIQMIGVSTGVGCDTTQSLQNYMNSMNGNPSAYSLSLIGSSKVDLFASTSVTIQNTFVSGTTTFPFNCAGYQTTTPSIPPKVITAIAGAIGKDNGASSTAINANPIFSASTTYSPSILTALSSLSNTTPQSIGSVTDPHARRADFIFPLAAADLTQYKHFSISANYYTNYSPSANSSGLSVWSNTSSAFVTDPAFASTASAATTFQGSIGTLSLSDVATLGSVALGGYDALTTPIALNSTSYYVFVTIYSPSVSMGSGTLYVNATQLTLLP